MAKKAKKPEFSIATIVGNDVTKKQLRGFVEELVHAKNEQDAAKEAIKNIVEQANISLGIPGKVLNQMVKEYLDDGALEHQIEQLEEAKSLTDGVFKV